MRVRTLIAGVTLAMFTTVLGAPAALAAQPSPVPPVENQDQTKDEEKDGNQPDPNLAPDENAQKIPVVVPKATLSLSPDSVVPGGSFGAVADCGVPDLAPELSGDGVSFSGLTGTVSKDAEPGTITIKAVCKNGDGSSEAGAPLTVLAAAPADPPAQQKQFQVGNADLVVSPDERRRGEPFDIAITCPPSPKEIQLTADPGFVTIDGDLEGGKVIDDANAEGKVVTFTLTCGDGTTDSDTLKIVDERDAYLDLDPNEGYRDDKIEVEAYCPGTADAKLNSPALDDIVLKRDGDDILRGKTRVEDDAKFGDSFAQVLCAGGERPADEFFVKEHRKPDLDLDPAFGKRGDEIKVFVICDVTVGMLESDVLTDVEVSRDDDDPMWRYRGKTTVVSDAAEGEHTVKIKCGDDYLEEDFFVIVNGEGTGGTQVTVYPKGAPQTGGGPVGAPAGMLGLAGMTGFATLPARRTVRR